MTFRSCSAAAVVITAAWIASPQAQQVEQGQQAQKPQKPQQNVVRRDPSSALQSIQGFNIVLLVGETASSGSSIEEVPPAARKALADMREFLPYKQYRVLDSHWTSCCVMPMSAPLSGRLQGVIGTGGDTAGSVRLLPRTFGYTLNVTPDSGRLAVRFTMRQDDGSGRGGFATRSDGSREVELRREIEEMQRQRDALEDRKGSPANSPDAAASEKRSQQLRERIAVMQRELESRHATEMSTSRAIVDSAFMMDTGETVVVGTSRLGGDKALIALVTAARRIR